MDQIIIILVCQTNASVLNYTMSNKIKKCFLEKLGVKQNQEMYYKHAEQNQEVHVEQNQVDVSNKMRFLSPATGIYLLYMPG